MVNRDRTAKSENVDRREVPDPGEARVFADQRELQDLKDLLDRRVLMDRRAPKDN